MSTDNPYGQSASNPQIEPPDPPSSRNTAMVVGILAVVVVIAVLVICAGIGLGLLLPAIQAARETARRMECSNNLQQISVALHEYHDTYESFPPAFTVDESGERLHSWRTLILPYMEQQTLYSQIDLDKPWDDPANQVVGATVVPTYRCPSTTTQPERTTYVAVVDPKGAFSGSQGVKMQQIVDGLSSTAMVVETSPENAVHWMSPHDVDLETFLAAASQATAHPQGSHAALCDGSVRFLSDSMDEVVRQELVTRDDAEDANGF